jgi:hypothetical protein
MSFYFEELEYRPTPIGALSLRRLPFLCAVNAFVTTG